MVVVVALSMMEELVVMFFFCVAVIIHCNDWYLGPRLLVVNTSGVAMLVRTGTGSCSVCYCSYDYTAIVLLFALLLHHLCNCNNLVTVLRPDEPL